MTGDKEKFRDLTKRAIDLELVLGDDSIVKETGIGTYSFKGSHSLP